MCKDQLCVKHTKFLTSHMPIFEYQSPMHGINSQNFLGGGKLEGLGGEASPLHPPVDETLRIVQRSFLPVTHILL